jgi:hypothetical protein
MYDLRFKNPSSFCFIGPSSSGKTSLVMKILRNAAALFESPECRNNIIYFYKVWQPLYSQAKADNVVKTWISELPTIALVREHTEYYKNKGGSICVFDDYGTQINREIVEIFQIWSHHTNSVIMMQSQSLFPKNPFFREISLNATYIVLFKAPRDTQQIMIFGKQFSAGKTKFFLESYKKATEKPYSYLFIDMHQMTNEMLRIRSHVLPSEFPMLVWTPRDT